MKSLIQKISFIVLMSMMSLAAFAQLEVKVNPIGAIFQSPDISVEYIATDNFGIEGRVGYSWSNIGSDDLGYKGNGLVFIGAGRYYFNPNEGGDRFYAGVYTKFKNVNYGGRTGDESVTFKRQRLAAGPVVGYKVLAANEKVVFDFNFGIGRAFINKYSDNATDDFINSIPLTNLDLISTVAVGYRF